MEISAHYVMVQKVEEPKSEGFEAVEPQDSFVYKGKIVKLPGTPHFVSNRQLNVGDVVIFAKYSPDTHEVVLEGEKHKLVKGTDILMVL